MLAKDLAQLLLESPDAEILVRNTTFGKWGNPSDTFFTIEVGDEIDIPKVYRDNLNERPDEVIVIDASTCIGFIEY